MVIFFIPGFAAGSTLIVNSISFASCGSKVIMIGSATFIISGIAALISRSRIVNRERFFIFTGILISFPGVSLVGNCGSTLMMFFEEAMYAFKSIVSFSVG